MCVLCTGMTYLYKCCWKKTAFIIAHLHPKIFDTNKSKLKEKKNMKRKYKWNAKYSLPFTPIKKNKQFLNFVYCLILFFFLFRGIGMRLIFNVVCDCFSRFVLLYILILICRLTNKLNSRWNFTFLSIASS